MVEEPSIDSPSSQNSLKPDTLLAAKLSVPPTRSDRVLRPRLVDALDGGLSRKLTLLSAPAGYGKTTLLSAWASSGNFPVAWVSLDDADNDLSRFFTYFITALRPFVEGVGGPTLTMLQAQTPPSIEKLAATLVNDLADLANDLVIVFDDYHFVDIQSVHDTIAFTLDHIPPQIHLVISTRSDPPLPLASLRAGGELIELRAADLRFTLDEATAFLEAAMGVALSEDAIAMLDDQIEGWAVGLQLAGLALKEREDAQAFIEDFSGSHRYVLDFLTNEVMQRLSDDKRRFMRETSILDSFTPALCDAVTTRQDSYDLLSKLETSNLFVVPLDDRREWYRYHRLFRDALNYRLVEQGGKQSVRELHRRAAVWYRQHDLTNEALRHWMKAREHAEAADLIQAVGHQMLARAQLSKLRRWLDALPAELVRVRPWLSIQYAWILNLTGQFEDMELRLQDTERALPEEDIDMAAKLKGNIATVRAGAARKQHHSEAAISYLQEALANLPKDDVLVRCSAHFNLGSTYLDMGEVAKGEQELRAAVRGAEAADNVYTLIAGRSYLADSYVLQGQLRRAIRTYEQAIGEGLTRNNGKPFPPAGYAYGGLGQVLYEQNRLDEAESHLSRALELGEQLADWTILRRGLPTLARLQQLNGLPDAAEASWEKALDLAQEYDDQLGVAYLEAYRARMWLEQTARTSDPSAFASAGRWAETYRADPHRVTDYRETFAQMTLAWAEIDQGDPKQAETRLEQLAEVSQSSGRIDCLIRILACSALAQGMSGQSDMAQSTLRQALELAAPEGYCRTFVDFGSPMRELLQQAAASDPDLEYVRSLLMVFSTNARAEPSTSLAEHLTNRELDVLRLLVDGFSNQEIADELVIALGTVKQYNHIIFRKLEVSTRQKAAKRARELKLL